MNETEVHDVEFMLKKTEQSIKLFSDLWDQRLNILSTFFKKRNRMGFLFFKSKQLTQEQLRAIFLKLQPINSREEKVFEIVFRGTKIGIGRLDSLLSSGKLDRYLGSESTKLFNNIHFLEQILHKFEDLFKIHKEILIIERELFVSLNEEKINLYIKRMDLLSAEFKQIIGLYADFEKSKRYLEIVDNDLKKVKNLLEKKRPGEFIVPSGVSAIVRVFTSNLIAAATIANPLDNPYFWDLTWRTTISVFFVNFIDYYFNVFTILTNKITKTLKLTR